MSPTSPLLSRGADFLKRQMGQAGAPAGGPITYTRGAQSLTITTAWVGRTVFRMDNVMDVGAFVSYGERDYLIPVEELATLTGPAGTPAQGDRITETINGTAMTFEALAPAGEPAWRLGDARRTWFRVHCKRVA
jgi:hypothetical protein